VSGYEVGYSFVLFKGPAESYSRDGGTVLFSPKIRRSNQLRNEKKIFERDADHGARITSLVEAANRNLRCGIS
jgi:hypothetical protein